ncbi:transglutaminase-like domain-containing protein [Bradyrhizobium mercantei]|uniref:transglutaminase-like domain-containing protein n=1 Tax=Bradyrhizobium mercantei TaxID=1904807 RepID=UPI003221F038
MQTRERNQHSGLSPAVSFPFPAAAMCLPDRRSEIGVRHIEMLAAALGSEGTAAGTIDAVFRYAQAKFAWANDTVFRPPVEVLRSSMGGCGHVNFLAALLLELNGIRCRGVAGFDPALREAYPGAGHTAIELLDPASDRWEYFDPYLDIRLPGRAASQLPDDPEALGIRLAEISPEFRGLGDYIDLGRIFRYRIYLDPLERLPQATMLQLNGQEDFYGRHWRLSGPSRKAGPCPSSRRAIHARARFIYSEQPISTSYLTTTQAPVASPWAYATI